MNTSDNTKLAQNFLTSSGSGDIQGCFSDDTFSITDEQLLKLKSEFELNEIKLLTPLSTRKYTIEIKDYEHVKIYLGMVEIEKKDKNTFISHETFYLFTLQTTDKLFLLLVTHFDIYDHTSDNPTSLEESLENYEQELRKCLGLKYAKIFFGSVIEEFETVPTNQTHFFATITPHFNQVEIEDFSYILFEL